MFNGISEEDNVHGNLTRILVVLDKGALHFDFDFGELEQIVVDLIGVHEVGKDGRLFVGTNVVKGLIEVGAEVLRQQVEKCLAILVVH